MRTGLVSKSISLSASSASAFTWLGSMPTSESLVGMPTSSWINQETRSMAYWARVGALPVALILMLVAVAADDAPGLSNGDVAHALNDGVGNLGAAVIKAVAGPFGGVFDQFFAGEVEGGELFHWVRDLLGLLRVACSRWRNIGGGYGRYKLWIVTRILREDSAGADPGQWPSGSDAIKDLLRSPRSP